MWSWGVGHSRGVRWTGSSSVVAAARGAHWLLDVHRFDDDLGVALICFISDAVVFPGEYAIEDPELLGMVISRSQVVGLDVEARLEPRVQPP